MVNQAKVARTSSAQPEPIQTESGEAGRSSPPPTNLIQGALWMIGISLLLFFAPMINGLIGGFVGGYKVGSARRAIIAALLPALVVSALLWLLLAVLELPVIGFIAGTTVGVLILLADVGIFVGALVGGAMSPKSI